MSMQASDGAIHILCYKKLHNRCNGYKCHCDCHRICFGCMTCLIGDRNALEQWLRLLANFLTGDMQYNFAIPMMLDNLVNVDTSLMCKVYKDKLGCLAHLDYHY